MRAALLCLSLAIPALALAHAGATGAVKVRMDQMKDIAAATKVLGDMAKSGEIDGPAAATAADRLHHGAMMIPMQFEERVLSHPTEALPTIWERPEEFAAISRRMGAAAMAIRAAGEDPAAFRAAFRELGQTCQACHQDFRINQPQ